MNRTLLRGRIGLAFLLVVIVAALSIILIYHAAELSKESIGLISGGIGALSTVMIFAVHALFSPNAEARDQNPTQPPVAASLPGVKP